MKRFFPMTAALLAVVLLTGSAWALESPLETVKNTTDEVMTRVKGEKESLQKNPAKMYDLVAALIFPHFDFNLMAQFVLGERWQACTPAQQAAFVQSFRTLLVRTYAMALLEYSNQAIDYPEQPAAQSTSAKMASVKQNIKQPGGDVMPVTYRLHGDAGTWKVFDFSVDGISLAKTYRSSFLPVLKQGGVDKLLATLATKNQEIGK